MHQELPDPASIRAAALRLLKVRPRSEAELRGRLERKGYAPAAVEEVLAFLRRLGYLDDLSFADSWVRSRMRNRPRSRRNLARELRLKGIAEEIIAQAVGAVDDETEWETCRSLARKRWTKLSGLPPERRRRRVAAFLQRRGYGTGAIIKVLKQITAYEE